MNCAGFPSVIPPPSPLSTLYQVSFQGQYDSGSQGYITPNATDCPPKSLTIIPFTPAVSPINIFPFITVSSTTGVGLMFDINIFNGPTHIAGANTILLSSSPMTFPLTSFNSGYNNVTGPIGVEIVAANMSTGCLTVTVFYSAST